MVSLAKAVKSGDRELMQAVLAEDFDPNERDGKSGNSILHLCVNYDELEVLRRVLESEKTGGQKVDVLAKNAKGEVRLGDCAANGAQIIEC